MNVIHMPAYREPQVRALYAECHPGWPAPKRHEFFAYPTLVVAETPESVDAYAQYWINASDAGHLVVFLRDTCVAPAARGRGLGSLLMDRRIAIGREMGAVLAAGATQIDNAEMVSILTGRGFQADRRLPGLYTQFTPAKDGVLYLLNLQGA